MYLCVSGSEARGLRCLLPRISKFFRARQTRAANKTTLFAFLPYYYSKYRGQWQVNEGENFRAARKRARMPRFYALAPRRLSPIVCIRAVFHYKARRERFFCGGCNIFARGYVNMKYRQPKDTPPANTFLRRRGCTTCRGEKQRT